MLGPPHVAIIGGGVSGSVALSELLRSSSTVRVTLFDQGRGVGGRASHRCVSANGAVVSPGAEEAWFKFDHGCQFFRADTSKFQERVLGPWLKDGVAAEWLGPFEALNGAKPFFGVPVDKRPVYAGVGGMHSLAAKPIAKALTRGRVAINTGVRVGRVEHKDGNWELYGVGGRAALHDTPEAESKLVEADLLGTFDAVLVTDASMSAGSWHRASAGLPAAFIKEAALDTKCRAALFTAMVAFESPLGLEAGGITFDDDALWFASRTASKPGLSSLETECWTLVSTPHWAAQQVAAVPMRDPITGAFRPQTKEVLDGPAHALLQAFQSALSPRLEKMPKAVYLTAQRWGSAFPVSAADDVKAAESLEILGTRYTTKRDLSLVSPPNCVDGKDYVASGTGLFYAGDYCSKSLPPGVEAAACSALDAVAGILYELETKADAR